MRRLIGFSSRRSCHEVTDEVKSHDMMSFSARLSRRAACPHAADYPNFMCSNGKTRPHPARCATFSPRAKATIGFSSRRSCHGVTDEAKSHGLILLTAVHRRPCRGAVAERLRGFHKLDETSTPPSSAQTPKKRQGSNLAAIII